jgi:hypothetical protein
VKKLSFVLTLVLVLALFVAAAPSSLNLSLAPAFQYPLGPTAGIFGLGGHGTLALEYALPLPVELSLGGGLGYAYDPYGLSGSISALSAELGGA